MKIFPCYEKGTRVRDAGSSKVWTVLSESSEDSPIVFVVGDEGEESYIVKGQDIGKKWYPYPVIRGGRR